MHACSAPTQFHMEGLVVMPRGPTARRTSGLRTCCPALRGRPAHSLYCVLTLSSSCSRGPPDKLARRHWEEMSSWFSACFDFQKLKVASCLITTASLMLDVMCNYPTRTHAHTPPAHQMHTSSLSFRVCPHKMFYLFFIVSS